MANSKDYCNVRKDVNVDQHKIANALPEMIDGRLELFTSYINERESIRKAKESGMPFPWTNDPILRDYRFTNVRRTDDTVSKWYIEGIAQNPELNIEQKVLNAILFRCWNKPETSLIFQQPIKDFTRENIKAIDEQATRVLDILGDDYKQYGSAYFQSGLKGAWKREGHSANRMLDLLSELLISYDIEAIIESPTPLDAFEHNKRY